MCSVTVITAVTPVPKYSLSADCASRPSSSATAICGAVRSMTNVSDTATSDALSARSTQPAVMLYSPSSASVKAAQCSIPSLVQSVNTISDVSPFLVTATLTAPGSKFRSCTQIVTVFSRQ